MPQPMPPAERRYKTHDSKKLYISLAEAHWIADKRNPKKKQLRVYTCPYSLETTKYDHYHLTSQLVK